MVKRSVKTSKKSVSKDVQVEQKVEEVAESVAQEVVNEVSQKTEEVVSEVNTEDVSEVSQTEEERFDTHVNSLMESMKSFTKSVRETMTTFQNELKVLMSQSKKLRKRTKRRNRESSTPNGFTKTVSVSPEMLKFCGKPTDTLMSRNEVNQFIHTYIREHNLQNPENKREIVPDSKLKKVLDLTKLRSKKELVEATKEKGSKKSWTPEQLAVELAKVTDKESVNYFNLQRLVNHHYL